MTDDRVVTAGSGSSGAGSNVPLRPSPHRPRRHTAAALVALAVALWLAVAGLPAEPLARGGPRATAAAAAARSAAWFGPTGSDATPPSAAFAPRLLPMVVSMPLDAATLAPTVTAASGTPLVSPSASTPTARSSAVASPTPAESPSASQTASPPAATATAVPTADSLAFDGKRALEHAQHQCQLGPRPPGTEAHWQTGDYAASVLGAAGWRVEMDSFSYQGVLLRNVIGRRGRGPVLIVGAHYDTRWTADREADSGLRQRPIVGGNDGASGVAVVLELARVLAVQASQREVWLTLFDAEDQGGIEGWEWFVGSTRLAERVAGEPPGFFDALVLLDMVGDRDQRVCRAADSTPALAEALFDVAADLGFGTWLRRDCVYYVSDDHTPFLTRGLAAVDLIDFDYPFWHTLDDTCDKIGADELQRVGRTVEVWIERGATREVATPVSRGP